MTIIKMPTEVSSDAQFTLTDEELKKLEYKIFQRDQYDPKDIYDLLRIVRNLFEKPVCYKNPNIIYSGYAFNVIQKLLNN